MNAAFSPCTPTLNLQRLVLTLGNSVERPLSNRKLLYTSTVTTSAPCSNVNWRYAEPTSTRLQKQRCVVLWLRIGSLRLADNLAVASVEKCERVLPIITVQKQYASGPFLSAALSVRAALRELGSNAVVQIVDDGFVSEVVALRSIAQSIGAEHVAVNYTVEVGNSVVNLLQHDNLRIVVHGSSSGWALPFSVQNKRYCGVIREAPRSMPRLPRDALRIRSDVCEGPFLESFGEISARRRLARMVETRRTSQSKAENFLWMLSAFATELHLGCLSRARVALEVDSRYGVNSDAGISQPLKAFFTRLKGVPALSALSIAAYDVDGSDRRGVEWDADSKKFLLKEWEHTETERRMKPKERWNEFWRRRRLFFMRSFFPDDVTPDYYSFTAWRFSQRCISATIGVFGTSSLLFALGIRSGRIGQAAVVSWVLKDGLGRVGKMLWAGSMGKDFDVDPKRWRFRSAMLYAFGNGLEIVTQVFPASFLLFATAANSMKQVSYLTSSATRNAMYRSFGDRSQNIANITAKGEAQIVVADLIGMGCGIRLSKILGSSRQNLLAVYVGLTALDLFGIYMELRQVVFRSLNAERSHYLINRYVRLGEAMSPTEVNRRERIFMAPKYRDQVRLTSIAKAAKDPTELELLLRVFRREQFIISIPQSWPASPCRLVLGREAKNEDVLRAMLMIGYVRKAMKKRHAATPLTYEDKEAVLRSAQNCANKQFPVFLEAAKDAGWNIDNLLFSTMKRRGYWGRDMSH